MIWYIIIFIHHNAHLGFPSLSYETKLPSSCITKVKGAFLSYTLFAHLGWFAAL